MERINLGYWNKDEIARLVPSNFIERRIGEDLFQALGSKKIVTIYGPRRSGKSSLMGWIIHRLLRKGVKPQNINYASMDYLDLHSLFSDTRKLLKLLKEEGDTKKEIFLFIDEIQRLENAGLILKQIYDTRINIRVITSGSSTIGIKDKIKEHLTGRQIVFVLYPFSFLEFLRAQKGLPAKRIHLYEIEKMKELNDLYGERLLSQWNEYATMGGYPEVVTTPGRKEWLFSPLFSTYLERDVAGLLSRANFQKFQDFVQLIASEVGKIYNRQAVSRMLGRDIRTIEKFEDILIITFILYRLSPFYTNIRKELSKSPRFYFVDTGLRNFISGEPKRKLVTGRLLEDAVIIELIKVFSSQNFKFYWWRSKGGAEVDLILKKKKEIIPVEIKGMRDRKPKLTRSFISFIERYKPERAYFITNNYYDRSLFKHTTIYFLPSYLIGLLRKF